MRDTIIVSTEAWLIPICILTGLVYAAILYLYERRFEFSTGRRYLMAGFRALMVSLTAFLLLAPFIRSTIHTVNKPLIIVAQDNSLSVKANKDSTFYLTDYPMMMNQLVGSLKNDYEVQTFSFGQDFISGLVYSFDEKQTNMADVLIEVQSRFINRNIGALIIAGDGIYNHGVHPYYAVQNLPFPLYTIALGDTTPVKDAQIVRAIHNRIAYLGNAFPIEIQVRGHLCDGVSTAIQVYHKGKTLFSETVSFKGEHFDITIPVELVALEPGLQRYTIKLQPVTGEVTILNNTKEIFVDVVEGRQKILMLYSSPHPDIAAIRQSVESHRNYEITVADASSFNDNIAAYNLVILHQIPAKDKPFSQITKQVRDENIPALFILGSALSLEVFNTLQTGLTINGGQNRYNESLAALNQVFGLFTLGNELRELTRNLPPLNTPFGSYKVSGAVSVLFYQQIGNVVTEMPLIMASDISGHKTGIITGEGIWRWRMTNYTRNGNHNAFNELIAKLTQYLSLREEKNRFRVSTQQIWNENENVEFIAEVYNASFESVNESEVEMTIIDESGKKYPFAFSPSGTVYFLNAGILPPGNYSYSARTKWQDEVLVATGSFSILPLQAELISTVADHRLLSGLAQRFGGKMYYPADLQQIPLELAAREDIKPLVYSEMKYRELIDITWLLIPLLLLLVVEWVLRRTSGGY